MPGGRPSWPGIMSPTWLDEHHLDGPRAEQPMAAQLAAVGEHLGEAEVIGRARGQPARARVIALGEPEGEGALLQAVLGAAIARSPGGPSGRRARRRTCRACPSGSKTRLLEELVERLPGGDLDDPPQRVDAGQAAVSPSRARLEVERGLRELRHERRPASPSRRARAIACGARRLPSPPLARPEVCVIRSRIVISRSAGTSWTSDSGSRWTATFIPLNSGMNFETGSFSRTFPSSIIIRMATPVTGLVDEAMRKSVSFAHRLLRVDVHHAPAPRSGRPCPCARRA